MLWALETAIRRSREDIIKPIIYNIPRYLPTYLDTTYSVLIYRLSLFFSRYITKRCTIVAQRIVFVAHETDSQVGKGAAETTPRKRPRSRIRMDISRL